MVLLPLIVVTAVAVAIGYINNKDHEPPITPTKEIQTDSKAVIEDDSKSVIGDSKDSKVGIEVFIYPDFMDRPYLPPPMPPPIHPPPVTNVNPKGCFDQ